MGCCKPRNVVWIAEFSDLHYKGITFLTMTSTHIVYLSNNRGIVNHDINMLARKGGLKTLESKKCCKQLKVIYVMLTFCGEQPPTC